MGRFDGVLLCTDLDDTLLKTDKSISERNIKAIEYFKKEGGLFAFATGRVPLGAAPVLDSVMPNAPSVCFNGGGIYDFSSKRLLWSHGLDDGAYEVVEFVEREFLPAGIEICTADKVYFSRDNARTLEHKRNERFPDNAVNFREVKEPWIKVIFLLEEEELPQLRGMLASTPYTDKYTFVKSSPHYFELLPKGVNKGEGLLRLGELLGIEHGKIVAMGDNDNDLELVKSAGVGIAVSNATVSVKDAADYITVDNNSDAVAAVIADVDAGRFF